MNYIIRRNIKNEPRAIEFEDNETANIFLAALDMYEALKQMLADYKAICNRKPNNRLLQFRLNLAEQALAKAENIA